jgi:hypothetical protein
VEPVRRAAPRLGVAAAIIASRGLVRRPFPVRSSARTSTTCQGAVAERDERPRDDRSEAVARDDERPIAARAVRPASGDELEDARDASANPSTKPSESAPAPRTLVRKSGRSGTIISLETSVKKLTQPSATTAREQLVPRGDGRCAAISRRAAAGAWPLLRRGHVPGRRCRSSSTRAFTDSIVDAFPRGRRSARSERPGAEEHRTVERVVGQAAVAPAHERASIGITSIR